MSCVLEVGRDTSNYAVPLAASGRLFVHTASGGFEALNMPDIPADQGGMLAIYLNGVVAYTVPFVCTSAAKKSGGSSGGVGYAGASDGGVGSPGASVGRLY